MTPNGFFRVTDLLACKIFPEAMQKEKAAKPSGRLQYTSEDSDSI